MRLATLLAGGLLLFPASEAFAHAQLVKADPAVGSTETGPTTQIWLKFNEPIRVPPSAVRLTWPDGHREVLKALARDPHDRNAVAAPLPGRLGPGRYTVEWRALSPDGHNTQGTFSFTVKG
jgi:methionine-rich copper-binding protein CopC